MKKHIPSNQTDYLRFVPQLLVRNRPIFKIGFDIYQLLRKINQLRDRDWDLSFCHTTREENCCADWLANISLEKRWQQFEPPYIKLPQSTCIIQFVIFYFLFCIKRWFKLS